ncbi:hypothetical protein AM571_CH02201 [Rhizobium etli 8C-3]|uniref:Cholesterol transport system auxiliary component n=2 Tax=Rhizobium TaxID=379 RepID=A0A4R3RYE8_9HYPH|nr:MULTISPECIES: ABC-type transport auxiliary lipoprotein family protein [Rhizobium]APO75010.1 hypothetical protein AM571_CH02201 [Rhizobium etli 8C-3]TCU25837.1 cholesterol transport system auxiliary component [Rhizobium azibense]TCU39877.1 cholesterol transport system auxiliary component [Rhizobium azibense]
MAVSHVLARRSLLARTAFLLPLMALAVSGCGTAAKNDTFDLSASVSVDGPAAKRSQILVPAPTALKALDGEQIVVRVSPSEIQYLSRSQWSDRLPRIVQSKLVEAFENSGKLGGVGKPGQGLAIDYQVVTDIRSFEIDNSAGGRAIVEISANILNDRNGTVRAQKVFRAAVPAGGGSSEGYVRALDRAFAAVTGEIVDWTLRSI